MTCVGLLCGLASAGADSAAAVAGAAVAGGSEFAAGTEVAAGTDVADGREVGAGRVEVCVSLLSLGEAGIIGAATHPAIQMTLSAASVA